MTGIPYNGPARSVAQENPLAERVRVLEVGLFHLHRVLLRGAEQALFSDTRTYTLSYEALLGMAKSIEDLLGIGDPE